MSKRITPKQADDLFWVKKDISDFLVFMSHENWVPEGSISCIYVTVGICPDGKMKAMENSGAVIEFGLTSKACRYLSRWIDNFNRLNG